MNDHKLAKDEQITKILFIFNLKILSTYMENMLHSEKSLKNLHSYGSKPKIFAKGFPPRPQSYFTKSRVLYMDELCHFFLRIFFVPCKNCELIVNRLKTISNKCYDVYIVIKKLNFFRNGDIKIEPCFVQVVGFWWTVHASSSALILC